MKKERTLKEYANIQSVLLLAAILVCYGALAYDFLGILLVPGLILMGYAVWYRHKYIRCPHCNKPIWGLKLVPKKCPNCDNELK